MKKPLLYSNLLLLALVLLSFTWQHYYHFDEKIPKEVLAATQKMRFIEGGSFNMGYGDETYIRTKRDSMLLFSNMTRRVTVASFYDTSNAKDRAYINNVIKNAWQDILIAKRSPGIETRVIKGDSWNALLFICCVVVVKRCLKIKPAL